MKSYMKLMLTFILLAAVMADNAYSVRYPSSGAPVYQFRFQPISGYASYVYLPTSSNPSSYGVRLLIIRPLNPVDFVTVQTMFAIIQPVCLCIPRESASSQKKSVTK
ncbi:hypothetical protein OUZ56_022896 [Daphnia magna]|uniref:Uncharacterized protein n=1 Tax=Daphnia magna TaxID=35525 RepID=A0ABR0AXX3_9CRUS|nr:hypothetical protein OUZ56_022896 [Daphnia magna]